MTEPEVQTLRPASAVERLLQLCHYDASVSALLDWIEPPSTALALPLVTAGLRDLLQVMQDLIRREADVFDSIDAATLQALDSGLDAIGPVLQALPDEPISSAVAPSAQRPKQPFRGAMRDHPLYTLIGSWKRTPEATARRDAVAAIVLFAKERSIRLRMAGEGQTPVYAGCKAARQLIESASWPIPAGDSLADWFKRLRQLAEQPRAASDARVQLNELRRLIEPVLKQRGLLTGEDDEHRNADGEFVSVDQHLERLPSGDRLIVQREVRLATTSRAALERDGLTLAEFDPAEEYVEWVEFGEDAEDGKGQASESLERSLAEQVLRAKSLIARRERSAQLLAEDWARATDAEIARFWAALQQARIDSGDGLQREALALLALALWTGRPAKDIAAMQIVKRHEDAPVHWSDGLLLWSLDTRDLAASVLRPAGQPRHRGLDLGQARVSADRVVLEVDGLVGAFVDALPNVQKLQTQDRIRPIMAFTTSALELIAAAAHWVREHAAHTRGRLTLPMVESWMFRRLVERRRDHALASLATGRPHQAADTGLHYLATPVQDLVQWLRAEQDGALDALRRHQASLQPGPLDRRPITLADGASDAVAGARIVPQLRAIQTMVRALQQAVRDARGQPNARDARLTLHNALTQYVHAMLRFGLGLRDVGQPLPGWDRIDLHHGVVLLSDKDDVAGTATRLVPLCAILARQLQIYARHCRATLATVVPDEIDQPPSVLFYLQRKGQRIERIDHPTEDLRQAFRELTGYTLPLNTGRHWLRSRLVQENLPGEMIEFFMGHWQRGAEPWGRYSTLPPRTMIDTLRPVLDRLVREAGFRALRGWS